MSDPNEADANVAKAEELLAQARQEQLQAHAKAAADAKAMAAQAEAEKQELRNAYKQFLQLINEGIDASDEAKDAQSAGIKLAETFAHTNQSSPAEQQRVLDEVRKTRVTLEQRLGVHEKQLAALKQRVDQHDQHFGNQDKRFSSLETDMQAAKQSYHNLKEGVKSAHNAAQAVRVELNQFKDEIVPQLNKQKVRRPLTDRRLFFWMWGITLLPAFLVVFAGVSLLHGAVVGFWIALPLCVFLSLGLATFIVVAKKIIDAWPGLRQAFSSSPATADNQVPPVPTPDPQGPPTQEMPTVKKLQSVPNENGNGNNRQPSSPNQPPKAVNS